MIRLINRSAWPTNDLRPAIEFGMAEVRQHRPLVRVHGPLHPGKGWRRFSGVTFLGSEFLPPLLTSGLREDWSEQWDWTDVPDSELTMLPFARKVDLYPFSPHVAHRVRYVRTVYGNLFELKGSLDLLVIVAAHEAHHVREAYRGVMDSEQDADRYAAYVLDRWQRGAIRGLGR
ncbi:MAG: hypothetical protein KGL39_11965 [Patescibacteria group bacterium]|nr:hypothetical protein [Patescibacteria group bacterium]